MDSAPLGADDSTAIDDSAADDTAADDSGCGDETLARTETCNGLDDDCDGLIDDDDPSLDLATAATFYADTDKDTYGDPLAPLTSCLAPAGAVATGDDCDDLRPDVHPGATEICNLIDDDCDLLVDDDDSSIDPATRTTFYPDLDGDGFGDGTSPLSYCSAPPSTVANGDDCDDAAAGVHPDATESCVPEGVDDDCDALIDDDDPSIDLSSATTVYTDADGDGYGDIASPVTRCAVPSGTVDDATDCDDGNLDVHPGAVETCASSGVDDDCDGLVDDDDPGAVSSEWFVDLDGDGFGGVYEACLAPGTVTTDGSDCDDDDADINPDATEVCGNGVDEDCSPHSCGIVGEIEVPGAAVEIEGTIDYAYAGSVVAGVGDVDGNGVPDFAIGAQADPTAGSEAGALYLFTTPPTGTVDLDDADAIVWGGDDWDRMGSAVSGLGQFDGDAYGDLAVAAMTVGASYLGAVYVYAGPVSGELQIADATLTILPDATYYVPGSVAGGGDTNGDGRGDLALSEGGGGGEGTTFLFLGPTTASGSLYPSDAVAELTGEVLSDEAMVKCFADVNADGLSDLVIAAPKNETAWPGSGRVYVALGPVTGTLDLATDVVTLDGALSENAGYTVANAGDADGDGTDDLFVGAWENTEGGPQAGGAYVVLGPTTSGSLEGAAGLITGARSERAGQFVAAPGDVDGDGWVDFFLSAYQFDSSTRGSFLVSGPVSGVVEAHDGTARFYADWDSYYGIGTHVGDLDGDGRNELLIGNQIADSGAWDGGGALLFYGAGD